ncbi:hypothetical protein, partial [Desulfosarcina cetonica]|uniref:hypothetical protein n=1 Tax=Desulfosarcina cetonica TaxID=90730 RepID=UPI001FED3D1D
MSKPKKTESPEYVHDLNALIHAWWKAGGMQAGNHRLPCGRCPHNALCTGMADADTATIRPFAFYPFYLLMLPAPTCSAEAFLRMIGGEDVAGPGTAAEGRAGLAGSKFLFAGHARWFLELLYLKLTFLHQVCRRFIPVENDPLMPEMALGLDGIGVDIHPGGAGLPAYWNFKVRVLDAIGTARHAPFAPLAPESPRFYFLGSLWFRALLVNRRQAADVVFDRIGRWIGPLRFNDAVDGLSMDMADPADILAPGQIFWIPDQHSLPAAWQAHWQQALRLGARLVHAGLKSGAALDPQAFLGDLEALLDAVRSEMLAASPAAAVSTDHPFAAVAGLRDVLQRILVRWEGSETPVETPVETFPAERSEPLSIPGDDET